jgi:SNF2 family DNA or RNA helicase
MNNQVWNINEKGELLFGPRIPSAREVLDAEFKQIGLPAPSKDITELLFSKIPLKCKIRIHSVEKGSQSFINLDLIATQNNEIISNNFDVFEADHVIVNGVWYPIYKENINEVISILERAKIKPGRISLHSYLHLIRHPDAVDLMEFSREVIGDNDDVIHPEKQLEIHGFRATLYPYQIKGYNWLKRITDESFGCILGDEMGLGKTVQVIALMLQEINSKRPPILVVCPSSILENWRRELAKFAPDIHVLLHSGASRTGLPIVLERYDLVITSYDLIIRDFSLFQMVHWNLLICDEAQAVKNPGAQRTLAVKNLKRRVTVAITGTPFENRLSDVWSIIDLTVPDLLGSFQSFKQEFPDSIQSALLLEPLVSPLILRRKVSEVAKDLPARVDIPEAILMQENLSEYYEQLKASIINKYGKSASLVSIGILRMFCCDPTLALKDNINWDGMNTKIQRLREIVLEIFLAGEKAIIFTSYTGMADKIASMIQQDLKCYTNIIDGRTEIPQRQLIIDEFSIQKKSAFLVLNPRAAGTGLNITAANHVIHYNLEWNPALEDQASARAYRRGQERPVFVHRLFYVGTIEEYVDQKVEHKRQISDAAIIGIKGDLAEFEEVHRALQFSPKKTIL